MKRVFLEKYDSSGKFQDGRTRFDIYLYNSDGEKYVWTLDWKKEHTKHLLREASQVEKLDSPKVMKNGQIKVAMTVGVEKTEKEESVQPIDFEPLALRLGEMLKRFTSYAQIERQAEIVFNFASLTHHNPRITNINSQAIYDWVMTLGKQPMGSEAKLKLLRRFVASLAPTDTPLARVEYKSYKAD